ncbi:type II toxin-antitoxin system BrnA family antitoxin [Agrobacterium larrymoorei]|uniref:type II toxin-antitoxin system BrnA family antitoxin n=1 Tax=Agrobacterium larrymoorei TaxID=160699 RepID=UPI0015732D4A|nr:CopG family antitoxin [Agrobacterium larrymoorei]
MKAINAEEFDRRFDDGEDVSDYVDWSQAIRPGVETEHVEVDLPKWLLKKVDAEASRLGTTRQSLLAELITEKLGGDQPLK